MNARITLAVTAVSQHLSEQLAPDLPMLAWSTYSTGKLDGLVPADSPDEVREIAAQWAAELDLVPDPEPLPGTICYRSKLGERGWRVEVWGIVDRAAFENGEGDR